MSQQGVPGCCLMSSLLWAQVDDHQQHTVITCSSEALCDTLHAAQHTCSSRSTPLSALSRRNLRTARLKLKIVSSLGMWWPAVKIFTSISDSGRSYTQTKGNKCTFWFTPLKKWQEKPWKHTCGLFIHGLLPGFGSSVWWRSGQWSSQALGCLCSKRPAAPRDQRPPNVEAGGWKTKRINEIKWIKNRFALSWSNNLNAHFQMFQDIKTQTRTPNLFQGYFEGNKPSPVKSFPDSFVIQPSIRKTNISVTVAC